MRKTSAVTLARGAEKSIERSAFAASYAKAIEDKFPFQGKQWKGEDKNPHFIPKQGQGKPHEDSPCPKRKDPETIDQNKVQPMEEEILIMDSGNASGGSRTTSPTNRYTSLCQAITYFRGDPRFPSEIYCER